jgi:hypothetical protein
VASELGKVEPIISVVSFSVPIGAVEEPVPLNRVGSEDLRTVFQGAPASLVSSRAVRISLGASALLLRVRRFAAVWACVARWA